MSWSVGITVKQGESDLVQAEFDKITYLAEPENTLKNKAADLAVSTVQAQAPGKTVKVEAYGSAYTINGTQVDTIRVDVKPIADPEVK